jgi:DNA replication ATP-dependent helicase Dna2
MTAFSLDASPVINDLRTFVCEEAEVQKIRHAQQMALPIDERVENGTCLARLHFTRLDEQGCAVFRHEGNDSRLREGDMITLGHRSHDAAVQGTIYREESKEIWISPEREFRTAQFDRPDGWFIDEAFVDLSSHYLDALNRLPGCEIGQERILPLLMGEAEPGFNEDEDNEYNVAYDELASETGSWEDMQMEAIAGCMAVDHCYLVQGPPGTGKTHVLARVVRQLVERGERVLITAFTHRAIDHALSAAAREIGDRQRVARFGKAIHRRDENYDQFEYYAESPLASCGAVGWVAAATPFALKKRLAGVDFDTIVIDEAGQMTTPLAIMAMLAGKKYLLFGDQQQLGPVVASRPRREIESLGIFHALRNQKTKSTMLDVTYRLNDVLTEWPSEKFYQGNLKPAPLAAPRRLTCRIPTEDTEWMKTTLDPHAPLVWIDFDHDGARTESEDEACTAAEIIRALYHSGLKPEEMAVVTPYRRQARRIRRRLETLLPNHSWRGLVIDTVERMQGQERDVILLSLCASETSFVKQQAEFLFDPHRLNVAATRARVKLIILASESLLSTALYDSDLEEEQDLLRSLRKCATITSFSE